jgi:hypothetical protein
MMLMDGTLEVFVTPILYLGTAMFCTTSDDMECGM